MTLVRKDFVAVAMLGCLLDWPAIAASLENLGMKTLVHCQVNFRASAFSFLYRVLYLGVASGEAKEDMNSVWVPDATWTGFIFDVLEANDASPDRETCLWENAPP